MTKTNKDKSTNYEAELWQMADALRGSMDAAEYKHVVLGLIFLKYISDAFQEAHAQLELERDEGADPEDPDEYRAQNIFWVPPEARWAILQAAARQPTIRLCGMPISRGCNILYIICRQLVRRALCWLMVRCRPASPARARYARI